MSASWLRSLCVAFAAALSVLLWSDRARAEVRVAIRFDSDAHLELAERLESELLSAGYTVDVRSPPETSPCDQNSDDFVPFAEGTSVWVHLHDDPSEGGTIVASICYVGTLPFIQRAAVRAPTTESRKHALATAEAVNGLRSKLPPWAGNTEQKTTEREVDLTSPERPHDESRSPPPVNSLVLGTAVVLNVPDFPVAPGVVLRGTLGISASIGIAIDAFVPTTGRELESPEVTATLRSSWLRVGPRFGWALGDFELSAAALAGPAVTWATGEARPPRVGTTDVTPGAVLSLATFLEYPRTASVFACASASASALLPGVRVDLGDSVSMPQGSWPLEAAIGIGARWGGAR